MQSTTARSPADLAIQHLATPAAAEWARIARLLPPDLDAHAAAAGALRRKRAIPHAHILLRILLAAVLLDWSFRQLGAWCLVQHLCDLSHVALLKLTRRSGPWVQQLLGHLLHVRHPALPTSGRLRLIDATVISRPGSRGTDWRLHLDVDLASASLTAVELTSAAGGESLVRFAPEPHAIKVADRGYSYAASLARDLVAGTWLIVRCTWQAMRLTTAAGTPVDVLAWLSTPSDEPVQESPVWLQTAQGRVALRLVRGTVPAAAAERARAKVRAAAQKKGRTPSQSALVSAGFVLVLTNLPQAQWSGTQVLAAYRLRWQIELRIKRLKSLFVLDGLRAHQAATTQTYLLTKLLAAVLVEALTGRMAQQVPAWWEDVARPVSVWRVEQWWWEALRQAVIGRLILRDWAVLLPRLQRYFCDAPRQRPQQLAHARQRLRAWFGAGC
jgi:hypothetical protein